MAECCDHAVEIHALHARLDALTQHLADRLPPEPLYTLPQAALLLYCSVSYLKWLLGTHRATLSEPKYRWDSRHRSHRMLLASDLATLRRKMLRPSTRRMSTTQREQIAIQAA